MSTAAKEGNGGAAMLPVQRKKHVRLLSNVQPEKRRDVSCWPTRDKGIGGNDGG
jgi:hypothetical protein